MLNKCRGIKHFLEALDRGTWQIPMHGLHRSDNRIKSAQKSICRRSNDLMAVWKGFRVFKERIVAFTWYNVFFTVGFNGDVAPPFSIDRSESLFRSVGSMGDDSFALVDMRFVIRTPKVLISAQNQIGEVDVCTRRIRVCGSLQG